MAEAISFRRGTTQENEEFIGCPGEIVVDLGSNDQSYSQQNNFFRGKPINKAPTLRVHLGLDGQPGGVVMARADMVNVNTALLAEGSDDGKYCHLGDNLAYASLSNLEETEAGRISARKVLNNYGFAYRDGTNMDTTDFTKTTPDRKSTGPILMSNDFGNITDWSIADARFIQQDLSDLDTAILAVGEPGAHIGKNLIYRDFSNINTQALAETELETDPGYTEDENDRHTGKDLAYRDLENVENNVIKNKIDTLGEDEVYLNDYQLNKNLTINLLSDPRSTTKYPSNSAVYDYVSGKFENLDFAKVDFSNVSDTGWEIATANDKQYAVKATQNEFGKNYAIGEMIETPFEYDGKYLSIVVDSIDSVGGVSSFHTDIDNIYFNANASMSKETIEQTTSTPLQNLRFNRAQFDDRVKPFETKNYTFLHDGSDWFFNGFPVEDISVYGITYEGTPVLNDKLIISYVKNDIAGSSVNYVDPKGGASFTFSTKNVSNGALMKSDLSNARIVGYGNSEAAITYRTNNTAEDEEEPKEYECPTMYIKRTDNDKQGVIQSGIQKSTFVDADGISHENVESIMNFSNIINIGKTNLYGVYVTEYGAYYKTNGDFDNFTEGEIIATKGYCDQKQNTQNIKTISSGTTIDLDDTNAIYCLTVDNESTITINKDNLNIKDNTARTFEIYLTVGTVIPSISWAGIDAWLTDSETTPTTPDSTTVFVIRVQKINNTTKVIANYGGDF